VTLIAGQPLLEAARGTNHTTVVTLYGNPGTNYGIQYTTNLFPEVWTALTNLTLTNAVQFVYPGRATNRMEFFRAVQQVM